MLHTVSKIGKSDGAIPGLEGSGAKSGLYGPCVFVFLERDHAVEDGGLDARRVVHAEIAGALAIVVFIIHFNLFHQMV